MSAPASPSAPVELLICTTCRVTGAVALPDAPRDGQRLADACATALPPGVRLRGVECLSNCDHGCTAVLRGPGRWSYVLGRLDPEDHATMLTEYAAAFAAAPAGLVPWRERPIHIRKNTIARIPPSEDMP
ncbi:MAG: DUF1636 domain-containing protein [Paracoccus sp. (in: a-proteobacteria)]|nr:DUF1636 domain-containing protein [Paracoccus sp. (in: a-proteobacteria)]